MTTTSSAELTQRLAETARRIRHIADGIETKSAGPEQRKIIGGLLVQGRTGDHAADHPLQTTLTNLQGDSSVPALVMARDIRHALRLLGLTYSVMYRGNKRLFDHVEVADQLRSIADRMDESTLHRKRWSDLDRHESAQTHHALQQQDPPKARGLEQWSKHAELKTIASILGMSHASARKQRVEKVLDELGSELKKLGRRRFAVRLDGMNQPYRTEFERM